MSTSNNQTQTVQIAVADPTPLGLFGLAIVTLVASAQKLGIVDGVSWVIPWALVCGSFAQLLAAYFDFCHKNIFGATIFGAFGFFWSGVAMSWMIKAGTFGPGLASGVDPTALGFAFLGYFLFACIGTIAAAEATLFLFVDMVFIDILLLGLTLDTLGLGGNWAHSMAAYAELTVALLSLYGAGAIFLNNFYGRQFWPLGKPLGIFKRG
ncbi:MAG TPA: acetate uptake transporter [Candidatus Avacidaminococcus intestinavium]|uniref:Acetate uptake transporter n=1 Tax=Candidatus Avacidaminococcus intestinavium TaxID=2840684 RepID=A0A9D1MR26_9FIRM|nr:acetate uptake transporter [Candidatus Avacidaminococcus intestinavium]